MPSSDQIDLTEVGVHVFTKAAEDGGKPVAIIVVDAHANPVWGISMPGTKAPSWDNALAKARTAVKFERDTVEFRFWRLHQDGGDPAGEWHLNLGTDGWSEHDLAQARHLNSDFCAWAGGSLILNPHDGSIMGAIGVSNREELEDHELASSRPNGWTA
jgi:uncharacterized protein GlcG (DUF336 family)